MSMVPDALPRGIEFGLRCGIVPHLRSPHDIRRTLPIVFIPGFDFVIFVIIQVIITREKRGKYGIKREVSGISSFLCYKRRGVQGRHYANNMRGEGLYKKLRISLLRTQQFLRLL